MKPSEIMHAIRQLEDKSAAGRISDDAFTEAVTNLDAKIGTVDAADLRNADEVVAALHYCAHRLDGKCPSAERLVLAAASSVASQQPTDPN